VRSCHAMGKKAYARCPRFHGVWITINGKCVFGGRCAAMLAVNSSGEFLPGSSHKCDTDYSIGMAEEWSNMSEENKCGMCVIDGRPDIKDHHILKFSNAIQSTISNESKIGQVVANGSRSLRAPHATCPKAALLHIAGMAGIRVEDKQALISRCTQDLIEGKSKTFFGGDAVDKESVLEMFGLFNGWVSHVQGAVDSQGRALCVHTQQIADLVAVTSQLQEAAADGARRFHKQEQANKATNQALGEQRTELAELRAALAELRCEVAQRP